MINLNKKIIGAPNFRYKEFIRSDTAIRKGIYNVPNEKCWECIEKLAVNVLQPIRNKFGRIRIVSGYRSYELNRAVGGSKYSNHMCCQAADIEPVSDKVSLLDIVEYVVKNLEFRNVILEWPSLGWVHADYREGANVKRLKLKDRKHNYKNVTLEYLKGLYG